MINPDHVCRLICFAVTFTNNKTIFVTLKRKKANQCV